MKGYKKKPKENAAATLKITQKQPLFPPHDDFTTEKFIWIPKNGIPVIG